MEKDRYVIFYNGRGYLQNLKNSRENKFNEPQLSPVFTGHIEEAAIMPYAKAHKLGEFISDLIEDKVQVFTREQPLYELKLKKDFMPLIAPRNLVTYGPMYSLGFATNKDKYLFTKAQVDALKNNYDMSMFEVVKTVYEV